MTLPINKELLRTKKVIVIGDSIVDDFWYGKATRVLRDSGARELQISKKARNCGGGAYVAILLAEMGVQTELVSVVGMDSGGDEVFRILDSHRLSIASVSRAPSVQTPARIRVFADADNQPCYKVCRIVEGEDRPLPLLVEGLVEEEFLNRVSNANLVIVSDHGFGVVSATLLSTILFECRRLNIPVFGDPNRKNHFHWKGAELVKPNLRELQLSCKRSDAWLSDARTLEAELRECLETVFKNFGSRNIVATLGSRGSVLFQHDLLQAQVFKPLRKCSDGDQTNAGDVFLAALAISRLSDVDIASSVGIASQIAERAIRNQRHSSGGTGERFESLFDRLVLHPAALSIRLE